MLETVNSQKSLISTLETQIPKFPCGQILFEDGQQRLRSSSYVRISVDVDIDEIAKFVVLKWFKKNPKIIIPIITGLSHFKNWKNQKQLNKFKRGIIKASYSTELVYITNGYNLGVSKLIGDAFREESLTRRISYDTSPSYSYLYNSQNTDEFDRLVLMGIVSTSGLKHADLLTGAQEMVTYKIEDQETNSQDFFLNPDHTHFILVDDDNIHLKLLKFRMALEKRLQIPMLIKKSKKSNAAAPNEVITDEVKTVDSSPYEKIPLVSLLIGGGIGSISVVLTKINQVTPVLVFKGTGHAPDLICGAYEDFADRHENLSDNHLRTALTIRITEKFPKESKDDSTRNKIKDNLLQIIKYSRTQVDYKFF